jgi:antitoxin component YwqK of YwqJK toxin-antitoxin module
VFRKQILGIIVLSCSLWGCKSADSFVECPTGSVAEGNGPPMGRRVNCIDPSRQSGMRRGFRHGPEKRWFSGTKIRSEQTYIDDELHGEAKTYFPNGRLSKRGHYHRGDRVGLWTEWTEKGPIQSETTFKKGLMDGARRFFYENEQLKSEHHYRIGIIHGPSKGYFPNGKRRFKGRYGDNVRQGTWIAYDENGRVVKTESFVDGKLQKTPPIKAP